MDSYPCWLGSDEPVSYVLCLEGGARPRSATGRLRKIVGHHEVRLRGLGRRTNWGTGFRQRSFFVGQFRNTQSGVIEVVGRLWHKPDQVTASRDVRSSGPSRNRVEAPPLPFLQREQRNDGMRPAN